MQDTQAPTTPAGLTATAISTSAINLAWAASTDNVGVSAYKILRGGAPIATLGNVTSYPDKDLSAATAYSYTVTACDAAGNCSSPSAAATATTMQNVAGNPNQLADCLFDWAEGKFPDFFAPRTQSLSAAPYYYRFYPPGTYLAIAAGKVFYLGPLSANTVLELGDVATWYAQAGCR